MTITLYNNLSDRRVLKKNITLVTTYTNVTFIEDTDFINPGFDLSISSDIIETGFNYCFCAETKRYYFIENITAVAGGRFILNCAVDVLQTYADEILEIPALIYTQTSNSNVLLSNSLMPQQANEQIQNLKFSASDFRAYGTSYSFIMLSYKGGVESV